MSNPLFKNPYNGLDVPTLRLNLNAPITEVQTVRSVLLEQGDTQIIWSLFLNHLANHVKLHKLTLADREQFINYILARCSENIIDGDASNGDVRRPIKVIRKIHQGT